MKYPSFLKKGQTIGISAPSAGVGHKINDYCASIEYLKKHGYQIKETPSVRNNNTRSASAEVRGKEFTSLFQDSSVDMVMVAAGGDFLFECLPYIDFKYIQKHPKWVQGFSDPTSILYTLTTKYDVATFYGLNGSSYDRPLDYVDTNLQVITGKKVIQKNYPKYMSHSLYDGSPIRYNKKTKYIASSDKINVTGRCIGGCIDCLRNLIGTEFDGTKKFISKYQEDGFIWYFDNFSLSAEALYLTLLQFKYAGYFKNAKAVILGRTLFPSSETGMTYQQAVQMALEDIPSIMDADVGHTIPHMTFINGAICHLTYKNKETSISFTTK